MSTTSLPILDFSHYHNPAERPAFLQALRRAARDVGFFYLTHHGISEALQQAVSQEARHFFALNDQQKQQVAMIHSPAFSWLQPGGLRADARAARLAGTVRYRR